MTSHCEPYSPVLTCSNTSATARSRSSREYFVLRAMIRFSTPVWSLHQTRGGSEVRLAITCGIDWAETHHDVALVDGAGKLVAKRRITDDAEGYRRLLELLVEAG